jgi:predicted transposase/invertase (TIGR01784 family)
MLILIDLNMKIVSTKSGSGQTQEEEMSIIIDKEPDLENAFRILEVYSSDPEKRQLIEERIRADRDYKFEMAAQFEKGIARGIETGVAKGLEQGIEQEKLETARLMKIKGYPLSDILEITGLTEEILQANSII